MRFSMKAAIAALIPLVMAERIIESNSLVSCQENSGFSASLFDVTFTPDNGSLAFNVVAITTISGNVTAEIDVTAYGYTAVKRTINPCELNLSGLCPLSPGQINIESNIVIPSSIVSIIPGIAYSIPDLDGVVQIKIYNSNTGAQLACVQAALSNGKTVYQKGVGWATAVIAGLALLVSALVSGLGHSNTAAHVAANALSLFGFMQTQAFFGMTAVHLPPIVSSWTQNFQWSMGIIHIGFIQDIATWYQRATGGTPSTVLSTLSTTSVNVQKRSLDVVSKSVAVVPRAAKYLAEQGLSAMVKRSNADNTNSETLRTITVRGIDRVGFRADIELTNIFMTGYIFFVIFVMFVIIGVVAFKWILEGFARTGHMKSDKFQDFRNGWSTVLKGILFRIALIGFPQMVVLCFWELIQRDSAGEIALAIVTIVSMIVLLAYACLKVVMIANRSITMHKNPAYILYSDPVSLHKWGFLYVQFKATAYWYIIPILGFTLVLGLFLAFAQASGITQAIGFLVIDAAVLVAVSILRPYMDKRTNSINIAIAAVNFVSAIFLLFFTEIFGLPGLVVGVMGVIFFILNAAFALILLIMVLVASAFAIFSKNPDVRYQPMRDDRGSFIKSQTQLTTELDALGATARGENKSPFKPREFDEDSVSGSSWEGATPNGYNSVASPYNKESTTAYDSGAYAQAPQSERTQSIRSTASKYRAQNNLSPWQRGAGYER